MWGRCSGGIPLPWSVTEIRRRSPPSFSSLWARETSTITGGSPWRRAFFTKFTTIRSSTARSVLSFRSCGESGGRITVSPHSWDSSRWWRTSSRSISSTWARAASASIRLISKSSPTRLSRRSTSLTTNSIARRKVGSSEVSFPLRTALSSGVGLPAGASASATASLFLSSFCSRDESLLPFSCGFQVLDLVLQVDGHPVERGGQSTELARLFRQASAQIAPGYASGGPSRCCQRTECGAGYKVTKAHTEQGEHGGHSYKYVAQAGECLLALRLGIEEVDVWPGVRGPTSNG